MNSGIIMGMLIDINMVKTFLLYSAIINYILIIFWFCVFFFAHDWMYKIHSKWFNFSIQTFDIMNYTGIGLYKLGVILLNLVPLIALAILT
jgi:Family of unknown function (DUF6868)